LAGKSPTSHTHAGVYEPVFSKNTGFNKNLGTIAGTVAEGNHNHTGVYATSGHAHAGVYSVVGHGHDGIYQPIDADLTAIAALAGTSGFLKKTATNTWSLDTTSYSLSSHNHTGVYEPTFSKNTAFNKNFGTEAGTVSEGNHNHSGIYLESETDPVFTAWDKSTGILITENQISNFGSYAVSGHNHSGTYEPANANIQSHISASSGNPHSVTFAELGGKPTTIAGYGLTDVYSKTEIGAPDTNFVTVFEAGLA